MSTSASSDRFILDGSVTLAWLFHDEADPYADAIVAKLPALEMRVPRLWHLEIANVLLVGERRGRCSQADTTSWWDQARVAGGAVRPASGRRNPQTACQGTQIRNPKHEIPNCTGET